MNMKNFILLVIVEELLFATLLLSELWQTLGYELFNIPHFFLTARVHHTL